MKISVKDSYRANTRDINMMPKANPLVLVFETMESYQHCMTYYSAERSMKKQPIKLTIIQLNTMTHLTIYEVDRMEKFLKFWRDNYFNPDYQITERGIITHETK